MKLPTSGRRCSLMPEIMICGISDRIERYRPPTTRDLRQDLVHVLGGVLAGPDARNESAVLPHVVGRFVRIEDDRDVEEAEEDDQQR